MLLIANWQIAYSAWNKAALKEAEALLLRHHRLPECNGMLELTVMEAQQLSVNTGGG